MLIGQIIMKRKFSVFQSQVGTNEKKPLHTFMDIDPCNHGWTSNIS